MKFPESWLRSLVSTPLGRDELARMLTMAGLEVEALEPVAPAFSGVVVARIARVEAHPNAERLRVCHVDAGTGTELQIVCGAPNAAAGLLVPCALVGAQLPGVTIKTAKLRGVESSGMLCSEKDLGLAEESSGLLILDHSAVVGQDIRAFLELDDCAFTLKLTPNRADCSSVIGVAREVAALTGAALVPPAVAAAAVSGSASRNVVLHDPSGCPRYAGRVIELERPDAPVPAWIVRRLERSGLRSISPVVDVTNYVMLELGQPLHAFDHDRLDGAIVVRFAREGEQLLLLNGQQVDLAPDMLVIADASGPVALAGIMGGDSTAVSATTRKIFLESAFFQPEAIAGRPRRIGLASDAAWRFERGVDFMGVTRAIERATELVLAICGGRAGPVTEAQEALPSRSTVSVRAARVERILGIPADVGTLAEVFRRLGFEHSLEEGGVRVTAPSHRFDLSIEADYVEEVARVLGYDSIPESLPQAGLEVRPAPENRRRPSELARVLAARDYQEVVTYSFVDPEGEADFTEAEGAIGLVNPMSSQMSVMRSTLATGLLATLRFNVNRRADRVRVFELARCFQRVDGAYVQPVRLGGIAWGPACPQQWGEALRTVDFFDVKADVEALLPAGTLVCTPASRKGLHPGRCAMLSVGGVGAGWLGELHPALVAKYDLASAPVLFEIDVEALSAQAVPRYAPVSKFPSVRRDIAVTVPDELAVQTLVDAMHEGCAAIVTEIALFDVYRSEALGRNRKSLAFRVVMQDTEQTLTEDRIEAARQELIAILVGRFGAELRE